LDVKLTILGSGGPIPDPNRAGPSTLVQAGGLNLLVDCGRGVVMRLAAAGLLPPMLHRVLLTHLHSDHITDFNDVFTTRWVMSPGPNPLPVTGPPGTVDFVERTKTMLTHDIGYRIAHHDDLNDPPAAEVAELLDGVVLEQNGVRVLAAPTDHRPVHPTIGFRVEHEGGVIALAGDTVPCEGLDRLCAGADVYVQTVIRGDLVQQVPSARLQDILDYHSSVAQAGQTAARAGVKTLVLTHMVPAVAPGAEKEWIAQAEEHFDGEIIIAEDLLTIQV
jgi:ribonuclease Z